MQLELEFATKRAELAELAGRLGAAAAIVTDEDETAGQTSDGDTERSPRRKPTGRRDVRTAPIAEERIEFLDTGAASVETTPMPPETFPRLLADTSLLAKFLTSKFHFG